MSWQKHVQLSTRAPPMRSPTTPRWTRTASLWSGLLQVPWRERSSSRWMIRYLSWCLSFNSLIFRCQSLAFNSLHSRQQLWVRSRTGRHIGRKSDQTLSAFEEPVETKYLWINYLFEGKSYGQEGGILSKKQMKYNWNHNKNKAHIFYLWAFKSRSLLFSQDAKKLVIVRY